MQQAGSDLNKLNSFSILDDEVCKAFMGSDGLDLTHRSEPVDTLLKVK